MDASGLPQCIRRGAWTGKGWACSSRRIIHFQGFATSDTCRACPYPEAAEGPAPSARVLPAGVCLHLGPQATGEDGEPMTVPCPPCGPRARLKAYECRHPEHRALHPLPTLPDCRRCEHREEA